MFSTSLLRDVGPASLTFSDDAKFDQFDLLSPSSADSDSHLQGPAFSFVDPHMASQPPSLARRMSSSSTSSSLGSELSGRLPPIIIPSYDSTSSPTTPADVTSRLLPPPTDDANKSASKKPRAPPRERILVKDFVPPDVSGLNKREARLIKNRAAAFLSRQRKREEFETMEVRVGELEAENARLRDRVTSSGRAALAAERSFQYEVETLRMRLNDSERRAATMRSELINARSAAMVAPTRLLGESMMAKNEGFDFTFPQSVTSEREDVARRLGLMRRPERLASGWGEPLRISLAADAIGSSVLSSEDVRNGAFELSFAPSLDGGRTHVTMSPPSPTVQSVWQQHTPAVVPAFAFELPLPMPEVAFAAGVDGWRNDFKQRMHVSVKRSTSGGMWDVDIL
ncbi:hypothetical protein BKA62DRAFT_689869 [Auriculariales sp. MPI-PUGE-AT-0066]|nr:hypothetical protein BKA62DRAFT_689869 [Auriculariales sp. MPI-PUGE-AT-0066]